jgi:rhodanese-related sulfurtransferase
MTPKASEFPLNTRLGVLAALLASLALFAGKSYESRGVTIDPKRLSYIIQNELDHVSATDLADWIMQQRSDFRVIDLRDAKAYQEYHIPGAQNLLLTDLVGTRFDKRQSIVLYSDGGVHAAQALFLLWAEGYKKAYMLKGGLNEWKDDVLHPVMQASPSSRTSGDSLDVVRRRAEYFGGSPLLPPSKTLPSQSPPREQEKPRNQC